MRNRKSRTEFGALLLFMGGALLVLTNGFSAHILASEPDRFEQVAPLAEVFSAIVNDYVYDPDVDKLVENALIGMMQSLDRNSSYIPPRGFQAMQEETEGAFDGIGIHIRQMKDGKIVVFEPIAGAPAAEAGIRAGDVIHKIDGVITTDMTIGDAANRIKGPRGREVLITVLRTVDGSAEPVELDFSVKRGKIPLESIDESRMLDDGIAYIRLKDFKKSTARDVKEDILEYKKQGLKGLVLDLRWNPGGLLSASRELCELFLPKNTLVVTTKGRTADDGGPGHDDMTLRTKRRPIVPETLPVIVLTSRQTASSSEIVTGALQFHRRALVVGERSYGKGSVQTIIPLHRPRGSALRLTTALYYTPAEVTIDEVGISPDVEVPMSQETQDNLRVQMIRSYEADPELRNFQDHGEVSGNPVTDDTIEDVVLQRAVEMINEFSVFESLIEKYHKDTSETQVASTGDDDPRRRPRIDKPEINAVHIPAEFVTPPDDEH